MAEGRTELTPEEIDAASEVIGLGAVIYNDLHQGPERGIRFDWDEMLSFDGNSAPYIQYTYARCRSILRKAGTERDSGAEGSASGALLVHPAEQATLKQLARYPPTLRHAGEQLSPISVSEWTYGLARTFTRFYHEAPVLDAGSDALRESRLALVSAVAQGLRNGLAILGIGVLDRM
jgi:arginyl-tRNA synthetase